MSLSMIKFDSQTIRMVGTADSPEWVAVDVCQILGIGNPSDALKRFKPSERGVSIVSIDPQQGDKEMLTVTEPGLYRLIFKSRKPDAEKFRIWVTHEVLPCIRKFGCYPAPDVTTATKGLVTLDPHELCVQLGKTFHEAVFSATQPRFDAIDTKFAEVSDRLDRIEHRKRVPEKTRRIHCYVIKNYYQGQCPCCRKVRIVNDNGERRTNCEFDHWNRVSEACETKTWAVCTECNSNLRNGDWKSERKVQFEAYQHCRRQFKKAIDGPLLPGMEIDNDS